MNRPYDRNKQHRRSIRLQGYDYSSPGAYFITICADNRECLFGDILDVQMRLNHLGRVVEQCWHDLPDHYSDLRLDAFIIMPNHVHGILILTDDGASESQSISPAVPFRGTVGAIHELPLHGPDQEREPPLGQQSPRSLVQRRRMLIPQIAGHFKMNSAKRINEIRGTPGRRVWQRNYYETVLRDETGLNRAREYILTNPLNWRADPENPLRANVIIPAGEG